MSKTAYPSIIDPVSITLYCNVPFDNSYKHHSMISSLFTYNGTTKYTKTGVNACESFLDRKNYSVVGSPYVYKRWTLTDVFNFDFKNGLLANVTLPLTNEQTNANFMKVVSHNQTWYYFITGIVQSNAETYLLSLELDVIMTYQDEFLEGMKDVPVFTKRKHSHRFTRYSAIPYCADFKTGEEIFSGVKPSLIKDVVPLHYKDSQMKKLEGIMWLYVCVDIGTLSWRDSDNVLQKRDVLYKTKDKTYPFTMLALPINVNGVTYRDRNGVRLSNVNREVIEQSIKALINDGSIHGAKISPYPPFSYNIHRVEIDQQGVLNIYGSSVTTIYDHVYGEDNFTKLYEMECGQSQILYGRDNHNSASDLGKLGVFILNFGFVAIDYQNNCEFEYEGLYPSDLHTEYSGVPSIYSNRFDDPKLLFNPFRKYKINAQYSSEGCEFYPELTYSEFVLNTSLILPSTYSSAYIGDNNFYTELGLYGINNQKYEKIGLSSCVNYVFPCGENALDVFNATSAQTFYQSKTASGITSVLSIIGGGASIALGYAGAVGTMGMSAPMSAGLMASGATAIAGGVASLSNTIKSTESKIEDLKNTPDSINISGSNFVTDDFIAGDKNCLPYIVIYEVGGATKQNANDFFYNYGYQVARQCYFNTELLYTTNEDHKIDNNLFGRTIFNYIQIQEDITNKINADIPYIVKKKLSTIFNEGITLWSFYGLNGLWNNTIPTSQDYVENWLFKNVLDNTEYNE